MLPPLLLSLSPSLPLLPLLYLSTNSPLLPFLATCSSFLYVLSSLFSSLPFVIVTLATSTYSSDPKDDSEPVDFVIWRWVAFALPSIVVQAGLKRLLGEQLLFQFVMLKSLTPTPFFACPLSNS